jgi:tetratricopeptide (TPR) repeat protein/TolB-like protein/tRNA A-37 threonylcarbamoyl transferase component Bud32
MSSQASRFARPAAAGASLQLEPGDDFGPRYRIESLIGEGGMGKVYKAYDKDLDRIVALKLVRSELASDPASMQRFKQELLLASRISHKNILRIHDLGDVEGMKFISMTYVEGEDLGDVITREGRLPLERAVAIFKRLCGALEAAHAEGVVHRDLKPRNILIDRLDNVYISDFGLAKSLEESATAMTRTGEILGTPRYMSPEQAQALPTDHQSDLYSLGLIFYEMVTGDVPFRGGSMLQVMNQRVMQAPKNPQSVVPELPDYIAAIIMRCLEKDQTRRYQSAAEILKDLDAGRAAPTPASTLVIPEEPAPVAVKAKPARRGWLIAAGALVVAVALSMAIPSVRNTVLRRQFGAAAPVPEKYMAILPFRAPADDEKLKYQAAGVVESLSAKLFQLKNVHLASAAAVETASKKDSIDKIAQDLGVPLVVQGTVQGSGDKISITVKLDDVPGKKTLWTQEFSGMRQDLLTVQDDIYNKLVAALDLKLGNEDLARGATHPTEDVGAYDLYLRAKSLQTKKDEKSVKDALDLYDQAIKKDPGFALAYAGLSAASIYMYDSTKVSSWSEKALSAAQQAQRLNDNLPEVHFSLGGIYVVTGKTAEAIVELKRALQLAPNSDDGYRRLGAAYLANGRKVEAIDAYQKAVKANPYYWKNHSQLGIAYGRFAEYDNSIKAFREVLRLDPGNFDTYANIGIAYGREGKWDESIQAFQKSLELKPVSGTYKNLGVVYLFQGKYPEAINVLQRAVNLSPNEQLFVGTLANAYRYSGQTDKAAPLYDRAIALCFKAFQVNPRDAGNLGYLALYYARKGDYTRALEYIRRARSINGNDAQLIYNEALVHAIAGKQTDALHTLGEAFQKGYKPEEAKNDPELKALRTNPEFDKLLNEFSRKAN